MNIYFTEWAGSGGDKTGKSLIVFTTWHPLYWIILPYPRMEPWSRSFGSSGHLYVLNRHYCILSKACPSLSFGLKFLPIPRFGQTQALRNVYWAQILWLTFLCHVLLFFLIFSLPVAPSVLKMGEGRGSGDLPPLCSLVWAIITLAGPCVWFTPCRLFNLGFPTSEGFFFNKSLWGQLNSNSPPWRHFSLINPGSVGHPLPNLSLYCANRENSGKPFVWAGISREHWPLPHILVGKQGKLSNSLLWALFRPLLQGKADISRSAADLLGMEV